MSKITPIRIKYCLTKEVPLEEIDKFVMAYRKKGEGLLVFCTNSYKPDEMVGMAELLKQVILETFSTE